MNEIILAEKLIATGQLILVAMVVSTFFVAMIAITLFLLYLGIRDL